MRRRLRPTAANSPDFAGASLVASGDVLSGDVLAAGAETIFKAFSLMALNRWRRVVVSHCGRLPSVDCPSPVQDRAAGARSTSDRDPQARSSSCPCPALRAVRAAGARPASGQPVGAPIVRVGAALDQAVLGQAVEQAGERDRLQVED